MAVFASQLEGRTPAASSEVGSFFAPGPGSLARYELEVPGGAQIQVAPDRIQLQADPRGPAPAGAGFEMLLEAGRFPAIEARERLSGDLLYVYSGDGARPIAGVRRYGELAQPDVYDGVSVRYRAELGTLERTFELTSGADASAIRLRYLSRGGPPRITADGRLHIGSVVETATEASGARVRFRDLGDGAFGLSVDGAQARRPLTITLRADYGAWLPESEPQPMARLADHPRLLQRVPEASPGDVLVFRTGVSPRAMRSSVVARGTPSSGTTYDGGDYGCTSIILEDGDVLDPSGGAFTNVLALVLPAGATVTVAPGGSLLDVTAAYMRIDGTLNAEGAGNAGGPPAPVTGDSFVAAAGSAGSGPGAGGGAGAGGFFDQAAGGGGAGYGGLGGAGGLGDGGGTPGSGGTTYGMATPPGIEIGSGGGSGASNDNGDSGAGGTGGGGLRLLANEILLRGSIDADGSGGGSVDGGAGGGGSGGGVLLQSSRKTTGNGSVVARGGAGGGAFFGGGGGGGGGGRIKFAGALDPGNTITADVSAGAGGEGGAGVAPAGGAGTVNSATATAPNPAGADVTNCATVVAEVSLTKSDSPDPVVAGSNLVYTVTVNNIGSVAATDVTVNDTLPAGVTLVSTSGCAEDPAGVPSCGLGNIAAGGSDSYTITVAVAPGTVGSISNTATAGIDETDPVTADNSDTESTNVVAEADLSITKTDSDDPVDAFDEFTYTVTVTNAGPSAATNVVVTDTLPPGVELVSTNGCAEDPNGAPTCTLGTIATNGSDSYTIVVRAFTIGTISNTATVSSAATDNNSANDSATEETTINRLLPIPTLDRVGLVTLLVLVSLAGVIALRRR